MTMQVARFAHKVAIKADEEVHILRDRVKSLEEKFYSRLTYMPLSLPKYSFEEGV